MCHCKTCPHGVTFFGDMTLYYALIPLHSCCPEAIQALAGFDAPASLHAFRFSRHSNSDIIAAKRHATMLAHRGIVIPATTNSI